jgi:hypothetical protein
MMRDFPKIVAFSVLSLAIAAQAQNVYIAQTAAGGNTGADCADARALSSLASTDWTAGNTIHLCGTITATAGTSGLVAQGSGTSGSPITVKFETNAVLESPYFGYNNGCASAAQCLGGIEAYHYNYIIIDGGTNGIIENTANGTDLANQKSSSGITLSGSNYIVRNLTIKNIYANDPTTGTDRGGNFTSNVTVISGSSNVTICNNTLDNAHSGIQEDTVGGSAPTYPFPSCASNTFTSGTNLYGNTLYDHVWQINPMGSSTPIVNIFNNNLSGVLNWIYTPNPANYYHTDGVIAFGDTGSQVLVYLIGNIFHDTAFGTAAFYCTTGTGSGSGCAAYIFNNVFEVDSATTGTVAVWLNGTSPYPFGPYYVYNNTFINNGYAIAPATNTTHPITSENNLVTEGTTGYKYFYVDEAGTTLTSDFAASDYNSFYGGRGLSFTGNGYWCWPQPGKSPTGCGASYNGPWASAGFDTHSISANPQINASYQLSSSSPDIRAGANLSSLCSTPGLGLLCYDKNGVARPATGAWDIGAFQFRGPNAPVGLTRTVK